MLPSQEPAVRILTDALAADWAGYSGITRLETLGFPGISVEEETIMGEILGQFHEVPVNHAVIDLAIGIRRRNKIKAPDAIVAATAVYMEATLVTRNLRDFEKLPGIRIHNPFDEK